MPTSEHYIDRRWLKKPVTAIVSTLTRVDVFLLWHVRHAKNADGSPMEHRDESGDLLIDEEYDDIKVIGAYSSENAAMAAIDHARLREGFRDEPDCFVANPYSLDEDSRTEGFVNIAHDED